MSIFRLFGVGRKGTPVTYKQPDEDESTLANSWSDHPQSQSQKFLLKVHLAWATMDVAPECYKWIGWDSVGLNISVYLRNEVQVTSW